jgi:hypothetical protein
VRTGQRRFLAAMSILMEDALLSGRAKLMPMIKRFVRMALLLLGLAAEANSQAGGVPGAEWMQLATPERAGWSTKRLAEIRGYVEEIGSSSAMIVQHGVVVAAWGDVGRRACELSVSATSKQPEIS